MIAQAVDALTSASPTVAILVTYGPMGVVLAWFMIRGEAKLQRVVDRIDVLSHRINGVTRAMLVDVMSRDSSGTQARKFAQEMLERAEQQDREKP